jgi:ferric-dicitrate binding protein FerR (iron transport regulator)
MLRAIPIGNALRWDPEELDAWIEAGGPNSRAWEAAKKVKKRLGPRRRTRRLKAAPPPK